MYDASIGRFHTQDRFSEKYFSMTPYQYGALNPVKYIDVNGDSLWINFGDNQRVLYQEGKLYTQGKGGLIDYEGNDKFVSAVLGVLTNMSSTEIGKSVVDNLSKSDNSFSFVNEASSAGEMSQQFVPGENGGGTIKSASLIGEAMNFGQKVDATAHELFHGYQYDNGQDIYSVNNEVEHTCLEELSL